MDDNLYAPNMDFPQENYPKKSPNGFSSHLVDFIQTLVIFGAIFAVIYLFIAQPHKVSGNSMLPNFQNGDYILTDKISYRFTSPQRGEVIVLKNPRNEAQDFIKRIIALPQDTIKIENNFVYVNNQKVTEPYLPNNISSSVEGFLMNGEEIVMASNQYFVMGDNRMHSSDSRQWGPVTREEIIGRVFFRYWPPSKFGLIKNYP